MSMYCHDTQPLKWYVLCCETSGGVIIYGLLKLSQTGKVTSKHFPKGLLQFL